MRVSVACWAERSEQLRFPDLGSVAETADGNNGKIFCISETLPQAVDMNTDSSRGRLGSRPPDVFHELQAGKHLIWIGEKLVKQTEFFLWKDLLPSICGDGEGVVIQDGVSNSKLMLGDDFCTAQKGFDPEGEFFGIKRFGNIVIHTGKKAFFDVGRLFSGREHEDGEVIFTVPKESGKGETICAGKVCFQQYQINAAFFEGMERFFGRIREKGPVAGICEEQREPSF